MLLIIYCFPPVLNNIKAMLLIEGTTSDKLLRGGCAFLLWVYGFVHRLHSICVTDTVSLFCGKWAGVYAFALFLPKLFGGLNEVVLPK